MRVTPNRRIQAAVVAREREADYPKRLHACFWMHRFVLSSNRSTLLILEALHLGKWRSRLSFLLASFCSRIRRVLPRNSVSWLSTLELTMTRALAVKHWFVGLANPHHPQ